MLFLKIVSPKPSLTSCKNARTDNYCADIGRDEVLKEIITNELKQ